MRYSDAEGMYKDDHDTFPLVYSVSSCQGLELMDFCLVLLISLFLNLCLRFIRFG